MPGSTLAARFDVRRNHLGTMRVGLALVVACVHAMQLGFGHQPVIGVTKLGDLAVDAFFVISGFLLVSSYLRLDSVRRYAWHRFLRIMPGFWVCLLVTALVVAPAIAVVQGRSPAAVFSGQESAGDFLLTNAGLWIGQFGIAGLPTGVPVPEVMNGSLWTLFYEALCYAGVVVLGIMGGLRHRPVLCVAVVAALWGLTVLNAVGTSVVAQERLLRFALLFLTGSLLFLYARRVPVSGALAAGCLALLTVALVSGVDYRAVAAPAFAYLVLWVAVTRPPASPVVPDLSYGLYVYHWPIMQLLATAGAARFGHPVFLGLGVGLAAVAAFASWHLLERPMLRLKDAAWVTTDLRVRTSLVRHHA